MLTISELYAVEVLREVFKQLKSELLKVGETAESFVFKTESIIIREEKKKVYYY